MALADPQPGHVGGGERGDPAPALSAEGARALLRAMDGRWVMIEAAPLEDGRDGEIAVTLRAAKFDLFCGVYALSRRERELVALLAAGLDTRGVARRLFISRHTVQDQLQVGLRKCRDP